MPRPGPRRSVYPIRASEDEIRPARELAEAEYGGNLSEAVRRIIAEWAASAPALRRGDTVTVHLVSEDGAPERRVPGTVKTLGNFSGPLVIVTVEHS